MQDEWARWQEAEDRRRAARALTPTTAAMLRAVLVAVADSIGRAGLDPHTRGELLEQVRDALDGRAP